MEPTPGQILRQTRARHGLSQRRLAIRAGTTQSAISRIENGRVSPTIETLSSLLGTMGEELELAAEPYEFGIDHTLLEENLALTPAERAKRATEMGRFALRAQGLAAEAQG